MAVYGIPKIIIESISYSHGCLYRLIENVLQYYLVTAPQHRSVN